MKKSVHVLAILALVVAFAQPARSAHAMVLRGWDTDFPNGPGKVIGHATVAAAAGAMGGAQGAAVGAIGALANDVVDGNIVFTPIKTEPVEMGFIQKWIALLL